MWPYYPQLLARAVPRYTSFPTAAEFHEGVGEAEQRDALSNTHGPVSLYLHIPYCTELCWYCGCNTGTVGKGVRLAAYMDALEREIELVAERLPRDATVTRIALGGGSPNAVTPITFVRLLDKITTAFHSCDPLISVEVDPRHFSAEWAKTLGAAGVSHVSLGVQTFSKPVQRAIGRVQPYETVSQVVTALRDVRAAGATLRRC
jgi:oxygen-independent coproporphyrinogen III oxidase